MTVHVAVDEAGTSTHRESARGDMRKPVTPSTGKGFTPKAPTNRAERRKFASAKRKAGESDNPEGLPEAADNTLFGSKEKRATAAGDSADASKKPHKPRKEVIKTDPAVQALAQKKRQRVAEKKAAVEDAPAEKKPRNKPHSEAVDASKHMWEKLRSEKTDPAEVRPAPLTRNCVPCRAVPGRLTSGLLAPCAALEASG
tara:strand:+ start:187 stop:783 length:597 start_codon:yes stop_codon:yes gene_type:complete